MIDAVQPQRASRWPLAAAALIALAVIAGAVGWHSLPIAKPDPVLALPTGPAIAVMPFDNLGGAEGAYFSNGLTEDSSLSCHASRICSLSPATPPASSRKP